MLYNPPSGSADANAPYVGKDVAAGRQGSRVPPGAAEFPQREIVAIIAAGQAMGLGAPSNSDLNQMLKAVRSGLLNRFPATGSPDAIAIAPQPVYIALVEGMRFRAKVPGAGSNTSANPTLGINSLSAPILRRDGSAVAKGDLIAGRVLDFEIDAAGNARLTAPAPSETPLPATASSTAQFTLASAQTIANNSTTQLNLQGAAPPWATFSNGTLTVLKDGNYGANLVGNSLIVPSAQTSHNTTFTIYINGQPLIPQTMVNWTNQTQQIGLSNTFLGFLAAGSTIAGWTYLGNSGTTDQCQVVSALLNVTKVF